MEKHRKGRMWIFPALKRRKGSKGEGREMKKTNEVGENRSWNGDEELSIYQRSSIISWHGRVRQFPGSG